MTRVIALAALLCVTQAKIVYAQTVRVETKTLFQVVSDAATIEVRVLNVSPTDKFDVTDVSATLPQQFIAGKRPQSIKCEPAFFDLGLIRFRGHNLKGRYDVHNGSRHQQEPTVTPAV